MSERPNLKQSKETKQPKEEINFEKVSYCLKQIIALNNEYKPGIPRKELSGTSPDNKFRIRKNYFQILTGFLQLLSLYIPHKNEALKNDIQDFVSFFCQDEFRNRMTTQEDLDKAKIIVEKIFSTLGYVLEDKFEK